MCQNCTSAALAAEHERNRAEFTRWLVDHHHLCDHCRPPLPDQPCTNAPILTRRAFGVPDDDIISFAVPLGLSVDAARRFVAAFGRLPDTYQEIAAWGTAHGYRAADGAWTI